MFKKILGILLLSIALVLMLAIIGLFSNIIQVFAGLYLIFTGNVDSYAIGVTIGRLIYWIAHIAITIVFWTNGIRLWSAKKQIPS